MASRLDRAQGEIGVHDMATPWPDPSSIKGGGVHPPPPPFQRICGPEGPAADAKRPHAAEGRDGERSETVVPEATD